ncbi:MAG TPA: hypothetical protein PKY05_16910 [Fibrobacteria bacterium]|nr:hypothetical protein [Fibrobacteria bacterium]
MKDFWTEAIKQLGMSAVLAFMLFMFIQSESRRWDSRMEADEKRWNTLFEQYKNSTSEALRSIEACCQSRKAQQ